jgi:hypothetical protein
MADTFTANYGWTKPDVGASDDTWGDKWNVNLDGIDAQLRTIADVRGIEEAPMDQQPYARDMGAWVVIPQIIPDAPNTTQLFGRFNSTWALVPIQADAPSDGATYGRMNGAWNAALAITGGTITGSLTVTGIMTVNGPNSMVLNAAAGNQRAILGQTSGLTRWQLQLGDQTAEGLNNTGSNFSLSAYGLTGTFLGTWLTIARADGATAFAGPVNMNNGAAVNGTLALQGPGSFYLPGGSAGQVLTTNGSAALSWANPGVAEAPNDGQYYARRNLAWQVAPGGMTDAPNDGTAYARKSQAWAHLTHTDITDWTATLAPYALTAAVPVASTTTPLMNGTAAVGTGTTWARADHVHPTDTTRAPLASPALTGLPTAPTAAPATNTTQLATTAFVGAATSALPVPMGDNRIINGDMRIDQRNGGASGTASGYTCDRWQYSATQAARGTWVRGSGSSASGFPYYLNFTSSSAYTPLTGDFFLFTQRIEADVISDFCWGMANAQPVTLSFHAASSLAGTFGGSLSNFAGTRSYPFTYSIPAANTDTKIVVTIPGDTGGTWVMSGNAAACILSFDLGTGATYRGPANGLWQGGNFVGANGAVNVVATNGAGLSITGVKLEVGSVATPYNRQSLTKSLADCQRYYCSSNGSPFVLVYGGASQNLGTFFSYPVTTRASPTVTMNRTGVTNITSFSPPAGGVGGFNDYGLLTATGAAQWNSAWTASAEL